MTRLRLLFCHGLGANPRNGVALKIQQWAECNSIPTYGLNYRDYGNAERIWNVNDWRRDIVNALRSHDSKTVIVGSSAGCQAVLRAAVDAPEAIGGLLLFSPGVGLGLEYIEKVIPGGSVEKLKVGEVLNHPSVDPTIKIKVDLENLMEFVNNCVSKTQHRIRLECPVRIVHGMKDKLVPFQNSIKLLSQIESPNKALYLINDGHFITDRTTIEQALDSLWDAIEADL